MLFHFLISTQKSLFLKGVQFVQRSLINLDLSALSLLSLTPILLMTGGAPEELLLSRWAHCLSLAAGRTFKLANMKVTKEGLFG